MFNLNRRIDGIFVIACWTSLILLVGANIEPTNSLVNASVETSPSGSICGYAPKGSHIELKCPDGKVFSRVEFASYGNPRGKCGSFEYGKLHLSTSWHGTQYTCIGKQLCFFDLSSEAFGERLDEGVFGVDGNGLAVQLQCDLYDPKISPEERIDKLQDEWEYIDDGTGPGEGDPYNGFGPPK